MPRWACRLTLKVKRVWVHRIQDISEEDAMAEGCFVTGGLYRGSVHPVKGTRKGFATAGHAFRDLWESIYPGSWDRNDWVWACEFEKTNNKED